MHAPRPTDDEESLPLKPARLGLLALRRVVTSLVALLAALPVWLASYPPLYDYYHWLFQGYVVAALLPWSPAARPELAALYYLRWVPTPNLAATLGIGLLSTVFDPGAAGRLFLVAVVLGFGASYVVLVRTVQHRPSVLELFAVPWAYGYLTYKGYLSSVAALAMAFAAIAFLQRIVQDRDRDPRPWQRFALAALGVACFLFHLVGWLILATAVAVYALWLWRDARSRAGRALLETLLPALILLGWYAWDRAGGVGVEFYSRWADKAVSLYEGLLLFLRTDPLPPPFPLFWANVIGGLLLLVVLLANLDRARRTIGPLVATGFVVAAIAVVLPIYDLGDMGRPDERLLLPGLLLLVAGLGHRVHTPRRWVAAASVIGLILGAHAFEYARASAYLGRIEAASEGAIAPRSRVASYTVWGTREDGGCTNERVRSIGTSTLKWFGLQRVIVTHGTGSRLMETSIVHSRLGRNGAHELLVELTEPDELLLGVPHSVSVVELFGCVADIEGAARSLAPRFSVVESGPGFSILERNTDPGG